MKCLIVIKSGPGTPEMTRGLRLAADLLGQGGAVQVVLLQDAVHLSRTGPDHPDRAAAQSLAEGGAHLAFIEADLILRGFGGTAGQIFQPLDYPALVGLMTSCDKVVGAI